VRSALFRYLPKGSSLPLDVWQKRHRAMVTLLWLHVPAMFVVGVATNHGALHVLAECSILVICGLIAMQRWSRREIPMVATTFGLLTASGLLVHFSEGVIEMHFHFFVIVAAVTLYQAWIPFLVAISYVVAHHTIIGFLDPSSVYNHPAAVSSPGKWAFIHGLFILGESAALLVAWRLNEDARNAAETSYARRLQEEEARRDVQERYKRIFENAVEGIYESSAGGEIVAANPALARIMGYESVEAFVDSGHIVERYVEPGDRVRFLDMLDAYGAVTGFEFEARRADGTTVWLSNNASAVKDEDGVLVGVQGMVEDISARKAAEAERAEFETQLRQAQKMEALGQLAGGVAHDFNNLLFVIQNYTRFGMDGLEGDDPRHEDLNEVLAASQRGADLVRQLLAFSRKDDVVAEVLDVNDEVTEIAKILRRTLAEHIDLQIDLDPALSFVEADRGHLQQVLMNLALNAQDAMPRGGRLSLTTSNVTITNDSLDGPAIAPGGYARLTVRDTGAGMEPEILERVFEPFFTTKEIGAGTGLGLATVYGIIEQWKGFITVDSEPGRGAEFNVYLPATAQEAIAAMPRGRSDRPARGSETVLVVEDEVRVLELIRRILTEAGFEVVTAATASEALSMLADGADVDLLLTDLVMPGASGMELANQAKDLYPELPFVFMSGYSSEVLASHGAIESVEVLAKPFSSVELLALVRRTLQRESAAA